MKCLIDGIEVNVKVVENMGFQGGYYVKAVEYNGQEYIVQKCNKIWTTRTVEERIAPLKEYLIKKRKLERGNDGRYKQN